MTEPHTYQFHIKSGTPPTIEIDGSMGALYVRFRRTKVARTLPSARDQGVISLDLDENDKVVGIEAVGVNQMSIGAMLEVAKVRAEGIDFSMAPMRWAGAPAAVSA